MPSLDDLRQDVQEARVFGLKYRRFLEKVAHKIPDAAEKITIV